MSRTWHRDSQRQRRTIARSNDRIRSVLFGGTYTCKTGKRCYATQGTAETALRYVQHKRDTGAYSERSTYQCRFCNQWHLTSWKAGNPR